jgi:predicted AlkP superfamily pyrophosphatase or phosphodiesterase
MILDEHLKELEFRLGDEHFLRPDYTRYSFAQIPALIEILLGTKQGVHPFAHTVLQHVRPQPQNVVLLMIDGFGYGQWLKYGESLPFFSQLLSKGALMPVTSVFPSTTAASVTTICSGLTPQEHGLIDWHLYMEELDEIIYTLPFTTLDARNQPDSLLQRGVDPKILFNGTSLFSRLGDRQIDPYAILRRTYAKSAFGTVAQNGANIISYSSAPDMLVQLRQQLAAAKQRSYFYVYWDEIDHISHVYEPHSEAYLAELNCLAHMLQTEFLEKVDRKTAENTVLLVTADHGQVVMKPDEIIYLNQWTEVTEALAKSPAGKTIYPWGNPRNVFLKVVDDRIDEVMAFLAKKLEGIASVVRSQAEADKGLFGVGIEHPQFRKRIGNILVLPYEGYSVWYQYPGHEKNKHRGMHGGMSREEMLTVLGFATLSDLL